MRRLLTLAGALLAGISFFLPFAEWSSFPGLHISRTGPQLGGAIWFVLLAAVVVASVQLAPRLAARATLRRALTALAALTGFMALMPGALRFRSKADLLVISAADIGVRPGPGAWGTVLGLAIILLAAIGSRSTITHATTLVQRLVRGRLSRSGRELHRP